tara:strand:- start:57 stop:263 length:207 start_codon:yes stop_codon:yes gene_type:complete
MPREHGPSPEEMGEDKKMKKLPKFSTSKELREVLSKFKSAEEANKHFDGIVERLDENEESESKEKSGS